MEKTSIYQSQLDVALKTLKTAMNTTQETAALAYESADISTKSLRKDTDEVSGQVEKCMDAYQFAREVNTHAMNTSQLGKNLISTTTIVVADVAAANANIMKAAKSIETAYASVYKMENDLVQLYNRTKTEDGNTDLEKKTKDASDTGMAAARQAKKTTVQALNAAIAAAAANADSVQAAVKTLSANADSLFAATTTMVTSTQASLAALDKKYAAALTKQLTTMQTGIAAGIDLDSIKAVSGTDKQKPGVLTASEKDADKKNQSRK